MKALSIKQPWAWFIINGFKDIENRNWKTNYRGEFLIHASQGLDKESAYNLDLFCMGAGGDFLNFLRPNDPDLQRLAGMWPGSGKIERGGIVGKAVLTDIVTKSDSKWFTGKYGFVLAHVQPLPFQRCPGKLSFFNIKGGE